MSFAELFASIERNFRDSYSSLPPLWAVRAFSKGRRGFVAALGASRPSRKIELPENLSRTFWGIKFNCGLFNAAGMFKTGAGYRVCAAQGAGAYLAGTVTREKRRGNSRLNVLHPAATFPSSGAAINWMGLPNKGYEKLLKRIDKIEKVEGTPIGVSVAAQPLFREHKALEGVVEVLRAIESGSADFAELNESCPNVPHGADESDSCELDDGLIRRLEYVSEKFLKSRERKLPLIAKFSTDLDPENLSSLIDALIELEFDGINLGNTSVDYDNIYEKIDPKEKKLFNFFTEKFGGGVSGAPLREKSLALASKAAEIVRSKSLKSEFKVIRTGGVSGAEDLLESEKAGIDLNQWFTGYFEAFSKYGNRAYESVYRDKALSASKRP